METDFMQAPLPFNSAAYTELLRLATSLFQNDQENQPFNLATFPADAPTIQETRQPVGMCTICRVEEATVSHFNVDVSMYRCWYAQIK
uniref:Uncharacterized protein n=1 Tax=Acrobeloides nanus TaxID=290746 RepID=A0A914E623_9BILA